MCTFVSEILKTLLGTPRSRLKDNIKTDLKHEENEDCISLAGSCKLGNETMN